MIKKREKFENKSLFDKKGNLLGKWQFAHEMMTEEHFRLWKYSEYIQQTDIKQIIIEEDGVAFKLKDQDILLACRNGDERSMPMDILNFRNYEKRNLAIIDDLLTNISPKGIFIDVGANIGYTSLHWSKMFPQVNLIAFEVLPQNYELLNKNIEMNHVENVVTFNLGLSNKNSFDQFHYYPWCTANSSRENLEERDDAILVEVKLVVLDELNEVQKKNIDFIKIDVEGMEKFVLEGMIKTIEKNKPLIMSELLRKYASKFNYHPNDVLQMLEKMGYSCYGICDTDLEYIADMSETQCTNFIFLHKDKHGELIKKISKRNL